MPVFTNELECFRDFKGDLLGRKGKNGNNMWETKTRTIQGSCFAEFDYADLLPHLDEKKMNQKSDKDKKKDKLVKAQKERKEKKEEEDVKDPDPVGLIDPPPADDVIQGYLDRIKNECHYDAWLSVGIALHTTYKGKGKGRKMWNTWSMKGSKHDEETLEDKWDSFRIDDPDITEPLGWKSIRFWANRDDPLNEYEALYNEGGVDALVKELNNELKFNCLTSEYIRIFKNVGKHEENRWNTFKFPQIQSAFIKYSFFVPDAQGKMKLTNPVDIWNKNINRRDIKRIAFDARPEGSADPDIFNIWQGYVIMPEDAQVFDEDDAQPILDHIFSIWCCEKADLYEYVMNWFAHILQKPWIKVAAMLALQSEQGAGKGVIFEIIGKIMGNAHFLNTASINNIIGDFNGGIEGKVLINLDEAFWGGDVKIQGKMKNLITDPSITINKKNKEAYQVENTTALSAASNNGSMVAKEKGDRRYVCLKLDDKFAGAETTEIRKHIEGVRGCKGHQQVPETHYGAFAKVLYNRDITEFRPRKIPTTALGQDQIERGWNGTIKWWFDVLTDGTFGLGDYDQQYKNTNGYDGPVKKTEYSVDMENFGVIKDKVNGRNEQQTMMVKHHKMKRYHLIGVDKEPLENETKAHYIKRVYHPANWQYGTHKHNAAPGQVPEQVLWKGEEVWDMKEKTTQVYTGYFQKWLYGKYVDADKKGTLGYGKAETNQGWKKIMKTMWEPKTKKHNPDAQGHRDVTWETPSLTELRQMFNVAQEWEYDWEEGEEIKADKGGKLVINDFPGHINQTISDDDGCMLEFSDDE
tara:strand:- start:2351 stop:4768 length:2418 start_codon:yes stop_codon:yes gene_type:complete